MFIQRSFFETLGGFDEDFFFMVEDVDLGLRAGLLGNDTYYVPEAVCFHRKELGTDKNDLHRKYFLERNRTLLLLKNYPINSLLKIFPGLFFMKLGKYISYFFRFGNKRAEYTKEIVHGWYWIFSHLGNVVKKRKETMRVQKRSVEEVFYNFQKYHYHPLKKNADLQKKNYPIPQKPLPEERARNTVPSNVGF